MKKILFLLAVLGMSQSAFAYESDANAQTYLNTSSPNAMYKAQLGDQIYINSIRSQRCSWSYASQGGVLVAGGVGLSAPGLVNGSTTIGASTALWTREGVPCKLPYKALIFNVLFNLTTSLGTTATGGLTNALISLSSGQNAGDLMGATTYAALNASPYYNGSKMVTMGTTTTYVKLTTLQGGGPNPSAEIIPTVQFTSGLSTVNSLPTADQLNGGYGFGPKAGAFDVFIQYVMSN